MSLQSLWKWLHRSANGSQTRPAPRRRARLMVEPLEDRAVPASFTAASVAELIGAIDAANLSAEADTITLAPGKTFTLTAAASPGTGLPVIAAAGGSLTIVGNGDTIERSATAPAFGLVGVAAGASLTLQDLTLQGGYVYGSTASGGGIWNQGTLTLTGVTVQNNTARGADAGNFPYATGGSAIGGGIFSSGVLTVQGSIIRNNLAVGGKGGPSGNGGSACGGGVIVSGAATFVDTTITGNEARGGQKGSGRYKESEPFPGPFGGGGGSASQGRDGEGYGGGLYIASDALVYLDAFTVDHVKKNRASTDCPNICGPYTLLS